MTSEAKIKQLAEVYLAKARRNGASDVALEAIDDHFKIISASIRRVEQARRAAEPSHVEALQAFAERAYRRPLSKAERDDVAAFYRVLRARDGLSHEDAVRDTVVRVLMSPHFCYRIDLLAAGTGVQPLSDYALASRLSYFLWSSMPDAELLARAAAGDLHRPEVLVAQARRMLRDDRVRGLATEFVGNWLDFRRFEEHNSVDRERFQSFNDALRSAMFEEPLRFFIDLVRQDRSVLDCLTANHTFVNPVLARHYGMPDRAGGPDEWVRVDDAQRYGRGGLLPMAVFLTKNAPGLRTSPVKRGYWVVRRLLGENIPAPPAQVPELPSDEAKLGELTLRETLARHRADKSCAGCHERFDAIGLAFEGYGPVGEFRTIDLGGRPVDTRAKFPGGDEGTGVDGLRAYLRAHRQEEFVENLCRKLLAYALGRGLLPSDDDSHRGRCARGSRPTAIDSAGWSSASSPAPSSGTSEWTATRQRNEDHERISAGAEEGRSSSGIPADVPPRCGGHDGPAVARVGPRLGLRPHRGGCAGAVPEAIRRPVHGLRRQPGPVVGEARRCRDGARARAWNRWLR